MFQGSSGFRRTLLEHIEISVLGVRNRERDLQVKIFFAKYDFLIYTGMHMNRDKTFEMNVHILTQEKQTKSRDKYFFIIQNFIGYQVQKRNFF